MKQKKEKISRVLVLVLLLALASAPQFTLMRHVDAQDRTINVNEQLDLGALGINNEAQQISSLGGAHARFFKRAFDLKQKSIITGSDAGLFKNDGDQEKGDLLTIKRQLESLVSKLKQGNHWNEAFDAQVLTSLKTSSARSLVTQAGGARKLFQTAIDEINAPRQDIDDEVLQVNSKTGALRNRNDRVFAAHARPPVGKAGCNLLLCLFLTADVLPGAAAADAACAIANRYNEKGCTPKFPPCN